MMINSYFYLIILIAFQISMHLKEVAKLGEFTEKRKTGEEITFVVQTAPPEMADELVDFMTLWFIPREPISNCGLNGDPVSTRTLQSHWREVALGGTAMIALQIADGQKPKLIGANMTPISSKYQKEDKTYEGEHFNNIFDAVSEISARSKIYEKYGIDRYLGAFGLSVDANYSGFNVGLRILESRRALCRILGLSATGTVFTAPASQHLARKAGFETLAESEYATCVINGKKPFAKLSGGMIMMGLRY